MTNCAGAELEDSNLHVANAVLDNCLCNLEA